MNPPMVMKTTRIPTQSDDDEEEAVCSGGEAVAEAWIVIVGNPATARIAVGVFVETNVGDDAGVEVAGGG